MNKNIFVGFAVSKDFLAAIDQEKPVNLSVHKKRGKRDAHGLSNDSTVLVMSQARDGEVLYFQKVAHSYYSLNGEPFGVTETGRIGEIAKKIKQLAEDYLNNHGLAWRNALISIPADYVTIDGDCEFLRYDKAQDNYAYIEGK